MLHSQSQVETHPIEMDEGVPATDATKKRVSERKMWARSLLLFVCALGLACAATAEHCRRSIAGKLENLREKYQQILDDRSSLSAASPLNEEGIPADLQAICDTLARHAKYAHWSNLQFLTGDFGLAKDMEGDKEVWRGRCGGFANYFLTEAAEKGYGTTIYYAALPKRKTLPLTMHFYAVATKNGQRYLLNAGHTFGDAMHIAVTAYDDDERVLKECEQSHSFVRQCFPTTEPFSRASIAHATSAVASR